jgi:hypothetical protein
LSEFKNEEIGNLASLKEGYLRLWYERMALENSHGGLLTECSRKDEVIGQLRRELDQRGQTQPISQPSASKVGGSYSQSGVSVSHWMPSNRNFNLSHNNI